MRGKARPRTAGDPRAVDPEGDGIGVDFILVIIEHDGGVMPSARVDGAGFQECPGPQGHCPDAAVKFAVLEIEVDSTPRAAFSEEDLPRHHILWLEPE